MEKVVSSESVCKKCGGTEKVCRDCGKRHVSWFRPSFTKPCPACQKPEGEKDHKEPCSSCAKTTSSCPAYFAYGHDSKPVPENCKGWEGKRLKVPVRWSTLYNDAEILIRNTPSDMDEPIKVGKVNRNEVMGKWNVYIYDNNNKLIWLTNFNHKSQSRRGNRTRDRRGRMSNDRNLSWEDVISLQIEINTLKYKLIWWRRYVLISFLMGMFVMGIAPLVHHILKTKGWV